MEFVSFFDTPEKLILFVTEFHQMLNKEEGFIDETLKQKLISFQIWLDDVIEYLDAFIHAEHNERWNYDEETIQVNCRLIGCTN